MRALIHSACLLGIVVLLHTSLSAQTASPAATTGLIPGAPPKDERYRIGYQDTLEVQVFRHPELNQRVNISSNGTISLFRLNEKVLAVCKTERELADDIAAAYRKDYLRNPEVTVTAVEQRSQAFAVIGAVIKPGQFMIGRQVRLLEL
ncbi:MAG TPA: polysaccharide biosynthesis/export family protein, partial [Pyrinomonadaceae bacterium]|nr:polysaccharide biosynthesis/export family protein [Pyrinomonadaceae bacterium]